MLNPTLELLHAQNEGEQNAIKQNAFIRFIGKLSQNRNDADKEKAQKDFNKQLDPEIRAALPFMTASLTK